MKKLIYLCALSFLVVMSSSFTLATHQKIAAAKQTDIPGYFDKNGITYYVDVDQTSGSVTNLYPLDLSVTVTSYSGHFNFTTHSLDVTVYFADSTHIHYVGGIYIM